MPLVSPSSLNSRFVQLCLVAVFLVVGLWVSVPESTIREAIHVPSRRPKIHDPEALRNRPPHPIDDLVRAADDEFGALEAKETTTLHEAAQAYRARRGRQPPPGFDIWHQFAQNNSAMIVEDFFDQIYHDLAPSWGVPAKQIREQAHAYPIKLSIRDGKASQKTEIDREWMNLWYNMTATIAEWLPDVDMPINEMDESRMVAPFEEIEGYMAREREGRRVVPEGELRDMFPSLEELDDSPPEGDFDYGYSQEGPYWSHAVIGCPPDSPARFASVETDFSTAPPLSPDYPTASYQGYVQNWTLACSPCDNPHLQGLHGTFVEPISISNTKKFFPLFGGSKLPMNNEILLPPAMYWTTNPFYSGGEEHGGPWDKKKDKLVWRGAASGGRNRENNWTRFQRHRFVGMMNATSVEAAESALAHPNPNIPAPPNFILPANTTYPLAARSTPGGLAAWLHSFTNAAVVHLLCFGFPGFFKTCPYTDPYFTVEKTIPMKEQYSYKYLPDIDGNSFSGRYRGFLGSTSLPIKATIYKEWHDSRLVAWKHFVPMDNTFVDVYGLLEYFLGVEDAGVVGHDDVAEKIAREGKAWAERVLRREDMLVYVLRLVLEFARVCSDERDVLGWKEGSEGGEGVT